MNDNDFKELFSSATPGFDDEDQFMRTLNQKLDAVESILQEQEARKKNYKRALVFALLLGMVSGIALCFVAVALPSDLTLFAQSSSWKLTAFLPKHPQILFSGLLAVLVSMGVVSLTHVLLLKSAPHRGYSPSHFVF